MALDITKFERVAGGLRKLFIYDAGADSAATVGAAGYFNGVRDQLDKADVIIVIGAGQTTIDNSFVSSLRSAHNTTTGGNVTTVTTEGVIAT